MEFHAALAALNNSGINFMKTELDLAHTFLDVAETTQIPGHRLKSLEDTQKAHRALLEFLPQLQLSSEQKLEFDQQLTKLEDRMPLAGVEL